MQEIDVTFAMMADEYLGMDHESVLEIGHGAGTWHFEVLKHLTTIQESYTEHDFYLVAYRNEERPNIPSISNDPHVRTMVPFIVVHALPKGTPPPKYVVEVDFANHTNKEIIHPLSQLPLQWVKVDNFPTGQAIMMLKNTERRSAVRPFDFLCTTVLLAVVHRLCVCDSCCDVQFTHSLSYPGSSARAPLAGVFRRSALVCDPHRFQVEPWRLVRVFLPRRYLLFC